MADTVTVTKIIDTRRYAVYEFTNESDGTGESSVRKIDLDDLVGNNGATTGGNRPTSLTLVDASWTVSGFNYVTVKWDRQPTDQLIQVMAGTDGVNYESVGGKRDPSRALGGTGDILLTTDGGSDGSSYKIVMMFRKKYS